MKIEDCAPGMWVIYQPHRPAPPEDGEVVEVRGDLVMVLYRGDRTAKATRPEDLQPGRA